MTSMAFRTLYFLVPRFFAMFGLIISASCVRMQNQPLKIACAANMELAMDSLISVFELVHEQPCELVVNASGILTTQIDQGASFEVFLSANEIYPNYLFKKGRVGQPRVFAKGRLIFAGNLDGKNEELAILLRQSNIRSVALADPRSGPYGEAAMEVIRNLNLKNRVVVNWVQGEGIGQVNQFLKSGAVDGIFTAPAFMISEGQHFDSAHIDHRLYSPILQTVSLVKNQEQNHSDQALRFRNFLFSDQSRSILAYFGYSF